MKHESYFKEVSVLLNSNLPRGQAASVIFDRYTSLASIEQREQFAVALIGELLVAKARMSVSKG